MERVNVRMPKRLRDAAERTAQKQGYADLSEFVRDAVREKTPRTELDAPGREGGLDGNRIGNHPSAVDTDDAGDL